MKPKTMVLKTLSPRQYFLQGLATALGPAGVTVLRDALKQDDEHIGQNALDVNGVLDPIVYVGRHVSPGEGDFAFYERVTERANQTLNTTETRFFDWFDRGQRGEVFAALAGWCDEWLAEAQTVVTDDVEAGA